MNQGICYCKSFHATLFHPHYIPLKEVTEAQRNLSPKSYGLFGPGLCDSEASGLRPTPDCCPKPQCCPPPTLALFELLPVSLILLLCMATPPLLS